MKHYKLESNEVVLYQGEVTLQENEGVTELILTNLNVVFINKVKETLLEEKVAVYQYPVDTIKIYEGVPQLKVKENAVEMYHLEGEVGFEFSSKKELKQFIEAANKLLTGETSAQRGAKKVRETIDLVDGALGVNVVQAAGEVIKEGVGGSIAGAFGKIASLFGKKKK